MTYSTDDIKKWKIEQIEYFKQYIKSFKNHSKEYSLIKDGIAELEKSL